MYSDLLPVVYESLRKTFSTCGVSIVSRTTKIQSNIELVPSSKRRERIRFHSEPMMIPLFWKEVFGFYFKEIDVLKN
jgi:hypothetical protein